jgi:hypothetical protein
VNIKLPLTIAALLPEQVQMELWKETVAAPKQVFSADCGSDRRIENCRVHNPRGFKSNLAIVQVKQFQLVLNRYLRRHHSSNCSFHVGVCPPDVMAKASVVMQTYGRAAREANPIPGNTVSEEKPITDLEVPSPHGLFVLFDRSAVTHGEQDPAFWEFNQNYNGFNVFQSHDLANVVQVYIWPENVNDVTGCPNTPKTHEELIQGGGLFGLRALFDCVATLQGSEDWWWELSRRCRLQNAHGPVPKAEQCSLNWKTGKTGYCKAGEKASSPAFETWFNAVRHQISLNLYKMGIIGSHADASWIRCVCATQSGSPTTSIASTLRFRAFQ